MKPKEFKVNTKQEFQELLDKKHFSISSAIVESILKNLKTRKKIVPLLSINCVEEEEIFDLEVEKTHFADTLKDNLEYFIKNEMYEECGKITDAIKLLDSKK